eukprot:TRINITY_DN1432_c0_g1_i2.p1 TRINITY_DN1432_c0_g1~~TRINITY_DN1432_c0_g1_i2.p1  ORF type:complete len:511 (-),score=122.50 TRINITY_DN1432_c0_g1_i2:17-1363(-)
MEGGKLAISRAHSSIPFPDAVHSRYRRSEYTDPAQHFFQWWNFIVFDHETKDHFTLLYGLIDFPSNSSARDVAVVSVKHLQESTLKNNASFVVPLKMLQHKHDFDLNFPNEANQVAQSLEAINADTYRVRGHMRGEAAEVTDGPIENGGGKSIEWDLTFHRVHGFYGSQDSEETNKQHCAIVSTLFGYNSEVEGTIRVEDKVYTITRSPRYRAYAAGSWGCELPGGNPPIKYPWSWAWLVIPNAFPASASDSSARYTDLSMLVGTAAFQTNSIIGDIEGGYFLAGYQNQIFSTRYADILNETTYPVPLLASSSDGYLTKYHVDRDDWQVYSDEFGSALIPLRQHFQVETKFHRASVNFQSKLEQYFRLPITIEKQGLVKVFSDFRAVGVNVEVSFYTRTSTTAPWELKYRGVVDSMNALEYAYAAPVNEKMAVALGLEMDMLDPSNKL